MSENHFSDAVLDGGLNALAGSGRRLDICQTRPTTYAAATGSASRANKTGLTIAAPSAASPNGRKVTIPAFEDGTITTDTAPDEPAFWALTDPGSSTLLMTGPVAAPQVLYTANPWRWTALDVVAPGVVAVP